MSKSKYEWHARLECEDGHRFDRTKRGVSVAWDDAVCDCGKRAAAVLGIFVEMPDELGIGVLDGRT